MNPFYPFTQHSHRSSSQASCCNLGHHTFPSLCQLFNLYMGEGMRDLPPAFGGVLKSQNFLRLRQQSSHPIIKQEEGDRVGSAGKPPRRGPRRAGLPETAKVGRHPPLGVADFSPFPESRPAGGESTTRFFEIRVLETRSLLPLQQRLISSEQSYVSQALFFAAYGFEQSPSRKSHYLALWMSSY